MTAKILILENSLGRTGAFNSIYEYTRALSQEYKFIFGIHEKSENKDNLLENNSEVFFISHLEIKKNLKLVLYLPMLIYNSYKTLRFLKKNQIGILHVNDIYNMIGVLVKLFRPAIYVIYHIRLLNNSYVSQLYKFWGYLINIYSDQIICVSESVIKSYRFNLKKTTVLYDSISPDLRKRHLFDSIDKDMINLYYISNYIKGKGQDHAIYAFSEALKINPHMHLTFVGGILNNNKNQRFKNHLIAESRRLNIISKTFFVDKKSNPKEEYLKADIILNFSENESFSMICLEALAYGKPLIASDSGGPAEIIDNKVNGILVPNRNISKMVEAIVELSTNKEMRNKFSINGPKTVNKKFNLHKNSRKLLRIYRLRNLSY